MCYIVSFGSLLWILRMDTDRYLSGKRKSKRLLSGPVTDKLFESNQVLFGLSNPLPPFNASWIMLSLVLTCLFYIDNIIDFSKSWEDPLQHSEGLFERLHNAQLKLSATKCSLTARKVCGLGHRVMWDGLLPVSAILEAIREIPLSQNTTELCSFLGLVSYYCCCAHNFATISAPSALSDLQRSVLPLDFRVPGCFCGSEALPHLLTHHAFSRFQPSFPAVYWYLPAWPGCHSGTSAEWKERNNLLCFSGTESFWEKLSSHQTRVLSHYVGSIEISALFNSQ